MVCYACITNNVKKVYWEVKIDIQTKQQQRQQQQ